MSAYRVPDPQKANQRIRVQPAHLISDSKVQTQTPAAYKTFQKIGPGQGRRVNWDHLQPTEKGETQWNYSANHDLNP